MKQEIRIIGGLYRGKKIHFPEIEGLRPTPNRVKETLFNWLMHDIKDACCLDAFAGSGSLGFEAYSRGAKEVIFVERAPAAYNNLKKIISAFDSPKLKLVNADAENYLQQCSKSFNLIFLDPPFADNLIPQCVDAIVKNNLLVKGGLMYLESPVFADLNSEEWKPVKLKQSGQVCYGLFEKL